MNQSIDNPVTGNMQPAGIGRQPNHGAHYRDMIMSHNRLAALHSQFNPKHSVLSTKRQKAAAAFAAECKKHFQKLNPGIAGAYIHNGKQYITDGVIAVVYEEFFDGLDMADMASKPIEVDATMRDARNGHVLSLPSLKDMSEQFIKAKGKSRAYTQLTQLGDAYYNTAFLIRAMKLLGIENGEARSAAQFKPLYIKGNGCEAIVMPVRVTGSPSTNVWHPIFAA